jgi:hypothetical protein
MGRQAGAENDCRVYPGFRDAKASDRPSTIAPGAGQQVQ